SFKVCFISNCPVVSFQVLSFLQEQFPSIDLTSWSNVLNFEEMEKVVENTTRQRLIERAAHHIELKGYFGTGINEILKETGIPKGSLYHHFPGGKDELIKEAIKYSSKKQQKAFADAMLSHKTVVDGLKAVIDYLINLLKA